VVELCISGDLVPSDHDDNGVERACACGTALEGAAGISPIVNRV